jgi:hypothetical protein
MILKDMSTGVWLFGYKYVLSAYLLCLSSPSFAEVGEKRRVSGGRQDRVVVLTQGGENGLHMRA